jgi:hypothetical protein
MLKKLLKHELKEVSRYLIPLLLSLVVITIVNKIFFSIDNETTIMKLIQGISVTLFVVINIAILAATFIVIIIRFYKNLLGDEGYLMFTLPVKVSTHIISKTIIATFWSIIATIVVTMSIAFVLGNYNDFTEIINNFIKTDDKIFIILFLIEFIIAIVISYVISILQIYASISLGQLFQKHKIIASFASYIGIYTILQIIGSIFALILILITSHLNISHTYNLDLSNSQAELFFHGIMIFAIAFNAALGGVFYYITQKTLSNKLNLE